MKKQKNTFRRNGVLTCIFVVPVIIALIVLLSTGGALFSGKQVSSEGQLLSIVGIAISVWVGLNIYNVIVREDVSRLIDDAKEADMLADRLLTDTLISKFRTSFSEDTVLFLSSILGDMDPLPGYLVKDFLGIEDLINFACIRFGQSQQTSLFKDGVKKTEALLARYYAEDEKVLRSDQRKLASSYLNLRLSDFKFWVLQEMGKTGTFKERCDMAREIEEGYKKSLAILLNISFPIGKDQIEGLKKRFTAYQRCMLAVVSNSIGATSIVGFNKEELSDAADSKAPLVQDTRNYEMVASSLAEGILPVKSTEQIIRNYGVSLERSCKCSFGEKKCAHMCKECFFDQAKAMYEKAYKTYHQNWKTTYCLATWNLKRIQYDYGVEDVANFQCMRFTCEEKMKIIGHLQAAAYWFERTREIRGIEDTRLAVIYDVLFRLTKEEQYQKMATMRRTGQLILS